MREVNKHFNKKKKEKSIGWLLPVCVQSHNKKSYVPRNWKGHI